MHLYGESAEISIYEEVSDADAGKPFGRIVNSRAAR